MSALVRWPGKRTSGRYVYKSASGLGWYWQCDLHADDMEFGDLVPTMQEAVSGALTHAADCPYSNEPAITPAFTLDGDPVSK